MRPKKPVMQPLFEEKKMTPGQIKAIIGAALTVIGLIVATTLFSIFIRPYDKPQYAEIDTADAAFLVPLEGETANQAKATTAEFYEQHLVHAKRVQITHRWNQTGRWPGSGEWIPNVRLIKVDRQPKTRKWLPKGVGTNADVNEAIHVESKDSINFSLGIEVTARVIDEKASTFLYYYSQRNQKQTQEGGVEVAVSNVEVMMDTELRNKVSEVLSREAGKYTLSGDENDVRAKKNSMMEAVKKEIVPYFEKRGVDIVAINISGGINFDNPAIQRAIDDAAQQSQLKVVENQKLEAQLVTNKRLSAEADGKAVAAKKEAEGLAQARVAEAEGKAKAIIAEKDAEAKGIKSVAEARSFELLQIKADPASYLALKRLEVDLKRADKWAGGVPSYLIEGVSGSSGFLFGTPPANLTPPVPKK